MEAVLSPGSELYDNACKRMIQMKLSVRLIGRRRIGIKWNPNWFVRNLYDKAGRVSFSSLHYHLRICNLQNFKRTEKIYSAASTNLSIVYLQISRQFL